MGLVYLKSILRLQSEQLLPSQTWWYTPIISGLLEDHKFDTSMGYINFKTIAKPKQASASLQLYLGKIKIIFYKNKCVT